MINALQLLFIDLGLATLFVFIMWAGGMATQAKRATSMINLGKAGFTMSWMSFFWWAVWFLAIGFITFFHVESWLGI
jgi:hypothetical protein